MRRAGYQLVIGLSAGQSSGATGMISDDNNNAEKEEAWRRRKATDTNIQAEGD